MAGLSLADRMFMSFTTESYDIMQRLARRMDSLKVREFGVLAGTLTQFISPEFLMTQGIPLTGAMASPPHGAQLTEATRLLAWIENTVSDMLNTVDANTRGEALEMYELAKKRGAMITANAPGLLNYLQETLEHFEGKNMYADLCAQAEPFLSLLMGSTAAAAAGGKRRHTSRKSLRKSRKSSRKPSRKSSRKPSRK